MPALIVAIAAFWSNGVMANFKSDPDFAPDWATAVSFITFVASLVLLAVHYIF